MLHLLNRIEQSVGTFVLFDIFFTILVAVMIIVAFYSWHRGSRK